MKTISSENPLFSSNSFIRDIDRHIVRYHTKNPTIEHQIELCLTEKIRI